jgi:hypothetical protein
MSRVSLFYETVRCRSCGHEWTGYLHGFSRGHEVLVHDDRIVCIPDDLIYAFPIEAGRVDSPGSPLRALGWRDLETCPACSAADFVAKYDRRTMREVPCAILDEHDVVPSEEGWQLTDRGRQKIVDASSV